MTDKPKDTTYSSVVSLKGLRTVMFLAELNGMSIVSGNIGNSYLEVFITEKSVVRKDWSFDYWD